MFDHNHIPYNRHIRMCVEDRYVNTPYSCLVEPILLGLDGWWSGMSVLEDIVHV